MLALWYAYLDGHLPWRADSSQVQEISIDYTNCITDAPLTEAVFNASQKSTLEDIPKDAYSAIFKSEMKAQPQWGRAWEDFTYPLSGRTQNTTVCILSFEIPNDIAPPILFYYRLTNFYQNHRRYVKSVDIEQLKGSAISAASISGDCSPLDLAPDGRPYYPCGLIANSMFNDTFTSLNASNAQRGEGGAENPEYIMTENGTSWPHEGDLYGKTKYKPSDVVPPPFWQDRYVNGSYDSLDELPNLHTWEPFQVWMRTAGLPVFSKLAQRNDHDTLKAGTYRLKIYDRTLVPRSSLLLPPHANSAQVSPSRHTAAPSRFSSPRAPSWAARTPSLVLRTLSWAVSAFCLVLSSSPPTSSSPGQAFAPLQTDTVLTNMQETW
jgi:hypothetical protein